MKPDVEMEEEDIVDFNLQLPCGHVAGTGRRPGLWVNDEVFGWCLDCGVVYNVKVLKNLMEQERLNGDTVGFIVQTQEQLEANKAQKPSKKTPNI